MTVYKDVDLVNNLIDACPDGWGIYIHVDKKSPISLDDINKRAKTFKEYRIYWGAINHLNAVLSLLKKAIDDENEYDYFHIITGQDFFCTSPHRFDNVLGFDGKIYMETFPIPNENWVWENGLAIYKYRTFSNFLDVRNSPLRLLNKIFVRIQKSFKLYQRLPSYQLYGGSLYMSLTRNSVMIALESSIGKHLLKHLKYSLCGEEVYFQTVIMNSDMKDLVVDNKLRYMDWSTNPGPKVLDMSDYEKIGEDKFLFCRKIDSKISKSLLDTLRSRF